MPEIPPQYLLSEQAPPPRTLVDILYDTATRYPDAAAIDDGTVQLTYAELIADIEESVEWLAARGIGRGDRVGIRMPSGSYALYVAILATLATGAAYVPVDADDPDERADAGVRRGRCRRRHHRGGPGPGSGFLARLARRRAAVPRRRLDHLHLRVDRARPRGGGHAPQRRSVRRRRSTNVPAATTRSAQATGCWPGLSVAFDASCEEMWLAWRYGACLVPAPRSLVRSGMDLGPWLVSRDITVVSTVPTLAALWPAEALEAVRLLIFGGEACPPELAERLAVEGREVWNTYGPTEATVVAVRGPGSTATGPVSIGLPLPGWDLAVVDKEGRPVGLGEVGELVIGGVGLARYLDPDKDAEKYAPMPSLEWARAYRSGDLVRLEHDGLYFQGRADDQVKVGGRRIELGEVDSALVNLPGVSGGAAAVRRTASGTPLLVGYVASADPTFDLADGPRPPRRSPARRAGAAPGPARRAAHPHVGQGRPGRAAVAAAGLSGHRRRPDLGGTMGWLAGLWRDVLGAVVDGPEADFFALGGGSLSAAQLVAALRQPLPAGDRRRPLRPPAAGFAGRFPRRARPRRPQVRAA